MKPIKTFNYRSVQFGVVSLTRQSCLNLEKTMKVTHNEVEYDIRNPAGNQYLVSLALKTLETRFGDRTSEVLEGLKKGELPQRGRTADPLQKERNTVLSGLLSSAGIKADMRSNSGRTEALSALAAHMKLDSDALQVELDNRAVKMRESLTA